MARERGAGDANWPTRPADWAPAAGILLFHLAFLPGYGVFRDELYYVACGRRPGWGYVDQPPLVGWVAWLVARVAGESHLALRVVAALAIAATVAGVVRGLSPEDRAKACVFGQNYGEAGAVEYFARELDLPPALSGHNSYWLWGPGTCTGEVLVVIGDRRERLEELFSDVRLGAVTKYADCMPYEKEQGIWVARGPKQPLRELWPRVQKFI